MPRLLAAVFILGNLLLGLAVAASACGGTWEALASIPIAPRQEHTVVAVSNTTLAVVGGIIPGPSGLGFNTTSIVQLYDVRTDKWSSATDAPIEVNHPNVATVNGKIYLLGGLSVASDGAWRAFPESWVYDPAIDVWRPVDPTPPGEERGSAAMGVSGKMIYLAGGMRTLEPTGEAGEQDTVDFVSAFDTESLAWVSLPSAAAVLPEGRDHAGAAVIDNKFYVVGGRRRGQRNVKDTVFVLDLENLEDGWTLSGSRMPTPRGGVMTGAVNGKIYVFGGEGNLAEESNGIFNETEVFNTKTETWRRLAPMSVPRHGGSATTIGNGIYLPGGGLREGGSPVDVLDVYRPKQ
ncbi:hypothetical protein EsH8_I_000334 [Colletotrichum jinshuiense]